MSDYWSRFKSFLAQPYKGAQEMTTLDWFLFLGVIIILLALWRIVFTHIEEIT